MQRNGCILPLLGVEYEKNYEVALCVAMVAVSSVDL